MEDYHLALPDFDLPRGLALYGVFDGHGGSAVAEIVAERLPQILRQLPEYARGEYQEALKQAFLEQDDFLRSKAGRARLKRSGMASALGTGSTAVVALLCRASLRLFVANCGDSRAVLVSGAGATALSRDHSPTEPEASRRKGEQGRQDQRRLESV
ncbi:unnamed protein product [Symbiodinium sp. KB8]|nr:unnamed protein product [Symbiodinium sp. KB8]